MKHYKIAKLLSDSTASKCVRRKWIKLIDYQTVNISLTKNIRFKTPILRLDLFDYSDAYIVVKRTIGLLAAAENGNNEVEKDVAFKNNPLFRQNACHKLTTH